MGEKLLAMYESVTKQFGPSGRGRLAAITMIPSFSAATIPDSTENLKKFETALEIVKKEFSTSSVFSTGKAQHLPKDKTPNTNQKIQRASIVTRLFAQRDSFEKNPPKAYAEITEAMTQALDVARSSIWLLDQKRTLIRCIDLYERETETHSSGTELMEKDFPSYFKAMLTERTIAAADAHTDPRTSCFSSSYLTPLGIGAMLDVPIWVGFTMRGVMCQEHVGPQRQWFDDEENLAYSMGGFVSRIVAKT